MAIDPFSTEGAKQTAAIAGQNPAPQPAVPTPPVTPTSPTDPFSTAGAQRISKIAGQPIVPQGTAPQLDPRALATQVNAESAQIYEQTKDTDIDLRQSEKIIRDLAVNLSSKAAPTPPPSLAELFTSERQKLGLEPLEGQLAGLDSEIERIQTQAFGEADKASERFASRGSINAEQSKIQRDAERQLSLLQVERSSVARQVDNKLNALQMTMQFTQQDYANAAAQYDREFSRSLQMIDLFSGFQDKAEAKQDKLADNARANLTTITNLVQQSGKTFVDMTPDQLRNIRQWEIQAGYPSGTFEAFGTAKPEAKILHTSSGTDAAGNGIVTFIYDDGAGKPGAMEIVKTGGYTAPKSSGGSAASDPTVAAYTQLLSEGKITVANVPQNIRNAVIAASGGDVNVKLSDTAIKEITQTQKALADLEYLRNKVNENIRYIGPVKGLAALNPFSEARKVQADVDRVRQTVGKALEGGVLRKEDEEKYKKILATLTDTPETAIYKIDALFNSITQDIENYKLLQSSSGRYVPAASAGVQNVESLRAKYSY